MNIPEHECDTLLKAFDEIVPFINLLARSVSNAARDRGFIRTLIGHKRHFNLWQPRQEYGEQKSFEAALPFEQAKAKWPDRELERAYTYKAFNALCQGGAAGQTKKALVEIYKAVGLPQMTVHDEISKSVVSEKETKMMNEILINCVPLLAPVRADLTVGKSWC